MVRIDSLVFKTLLKWSIGIQNNSNIQTWWTLSWCIVTEKKILHMKTKKIVCYLKLMIGKRRTRTGSVKCAALCSKLLWILVIVSQLIGPIVCNSAAEIRHKLDARGQDNGQPLMTCQQWRVCMRDLSNECKCGI